MSVTLTQSTAAGFPDRPVGSPMGLRVQMQTGDDGRYLSHDLGAALSTFYVRVMMNPATAQGGSVVVLRGLNTAGTETFRLDYQTSTRQLELKLATGASMTGVLPAGLAWHCVEVECRTGDGQAALWINGINGAQATGTFTSLATRTVWLGGFLKDTATTGDLYLDEWIVADQRIGPVVMAPTKNDASDPARWLVIYNLDLADSITWADHYRQVRQVPYANLCGLHLGTGETISASAYATLDQAINQYLDNHGLASQVVGILLGHGVPGYADFSGQVEAIASLLHDRGPNHGAMVNPLVGSEELARLTVADLDGLRLTARIDGPDWSASLAMVDRAVQLQATGLGDGALAKLWLDPYTVEDVYTQPGIEAMVDWAGSLDRMRLRLPMQVSAAGSSGQDGNFSAIHSDGFFWGWSQTTPPADFFGLPVGERVFCGQVSPDVVTAGSLRSLPGQWMPTALAAGYAAGAGSCRVYSYSGLLRIQPFFESLRRGWTLAEAWFLACPVLRDGLFLVGDPLLTVAFPQAGWEVCGPVNRVEDLEVDQPTALLREDETQWLAGSAEQPEEGQGGLYLVRHQDQAGRMELSATVVRVMNSAGLAQGLLPGAIWPTQQDWLIRRVEGGLEWLLMWEQSWPASRLPVQVDLECEPQGQAVEVRNSLSMKAGQSLVRLTGSVP